MVVGFWIVTLTIMFSMAMRIAALSSRAITRWINSSTRCAANLNSRLTRPKEAIYR